jgi:hypothetical protein
VKIYPDAAHGFLFQHHEDFAADVNAFLGCLPDGLAKVSSEGAIPAECADE